MWGQDPTVSLWMLHRMEVEWQLCPTTPLSAVGITRNQRANQLSSKLPHSSLSSSSPLVPLLQRWKQWTVEARKKLVMMATTETEMPEKIMMSRSVSVRLAWHSRKLSLDSWVRETRRPSIGSEHSMPSTPVVPKQETGLHQCSVLPTLHPQIIKYLHQIWICGIYIGKNFIQYP